MPQAFRAPYQIRIPNVQAPWHRRIALGALRGLPFGQAIFMRAYNRALRELGPVRLARTYFGATMECDLLDQISNYIYHFGVWEPNISAVIQENLSPGDFFCDIGANIGYDTLLASSLTGPTGKVVAVEPSPRVFPKLQRNLALNAAENVRTVQAAVSAMRGRATLYHDPTLNCGTTSVLPGPGRLDIGAVPAITMNDLLTAEEKERIKIIKIDVEGAEGQILSQILHILDTLRRDILIFVELNPQNGENHDDVFTGFLDAGFCAWSIKNNYDLIDGYLNFAGVTPPISIDKPPTAQTDIVFTANDIPPLSA